MEHQIDSLIAGYITLCGNVFIAPQFKVVFDKENKDGGSCPDYVALDFKAKEVVVIEVSTASNLKTLFERVDDRNTRWFVPLFRFFSDKAIQIRDPGTPRSSSVNDSQWGLRFLGFVRSANVDAANRTYAGDPDVWFHSIDASLVSYAYWDDRMKNGLPRRSA